MAVGVLAAVSCQTLGVPVDFAEACSVACEMQETTRWTVSGQGGKL